MKISPMKFNTDLKYLQILTVRFMVTIENLSDLPFQDDFYVCVNGKKWLEKPFNSMTLAMIEQHEVAKQLKIWFPYALICKI